MGVGDSPFAKQFRWNCIALGHTPPSQYQHCLFINLFDLLRAFLGDEFVDFLGDNAVQEVRFVYELGAFQHHAFHEGTFNIVDAKCGLDDSAFFKIESGG